MEYLILISVISFAIVAIILPFQNLFIENVSDLSNNMASESNGSLLDAGVQP